ncbi:MAG: hypothetical protein KatS3mg070_2093 [Meiothermus sp.]|uniref:EndoU domain-containing protein n=1 Tax=Meiothermus sp. TaxID=1955249 RepID=UPI0021DEBD31|nr:EndoU domain-containing protein [Meiothermus sp.]GIW28730.1 MAG: hypothetical protein KatS3mg070_2093 [Meiothermus sp.]
MGDAVDGLEQLYNAATGRQVDPVLAVLSAAGLALDLGTGGVGDVTTGVKAAYRVSLSISRQGGGLVALVIREQFVQFTRGRLSPQALVDGLRQRFGRMVDLARARGCGGFSLNNICLRRYDKIATSVRVAGGLTPESALSRVDETLTIAKPKTPNTVLQLVFTDVVLSCVRGAVSPSGVQAASAVFCDKVNIAHIFEGEINKKGKAVGFHYFGDGTLAMGKARIDQVVDPPNAKGFYRAKVSVFNPTTRQWVAKGPVSSMWPDSWTPQEVFDDILSAFQNATFKPGSAEWTGISARGTQVRGYLLDGTKDLINTAFPIIQ